MGGWRQVGGWRVATAAVVIVHPVTCPVAEKRTALHKLLVGLQHAFEVWASCQTIIVVITVEQVVARMPSNSFPSS